MIAEKIIGQYIPRGYREELGGDEREVDVGWTASVRFIQRG